MIAAVVSSGTTASGAQAPGSTACSEPSRVMTSPVGTQAGSAQASSASRNSRADSQGRRSRRGSADAFHSASGDSSSTPMRGAEVSLIASSSRPEPPSTANGTQNSRRPTTKSSAAAGIRTQYNAASAGTNRPGAQYSLPSPPVEAISTQAAPAKVVAQPSQVQAA